MGSSSRDEPGSADCEDWPAVTKRSLIRLAQAGPVVDDQLVYDGVTVRRCLTVVVPVPAEIAHAVVDACADLIRHTTGHLHYDPGWLHITVLDVTPAFLAGAASTTVVERVREVAEAHPAFEVTIDGLAVLPSALVATARSADGGIIGLRARLRERLGQRAPGPTPERAWSTVVRFRHHRVDGLAQLARHDDRPEFGTFTARSLNVVDTDKFYDRGHPRLIDEVMLASAPS